MCFFWFSLDCFVFMLFDCVLLGLVSSVLCQEIGWEERLLDERLCVEWDVKTSVNHAGFLLPEPINHE